MVRRIMSFVEKNQLALSIVFSSGKIKPINDRVAHVAVFRHKILVKKRQNFYFRPKLRLREPVAQTSYES